MNWLRFFPLAFSQAPERTHVDRLRALMADVPVGYRRTQDGHPWKLRMGRWQAKADRILRKVG